MKSNRVKTQLSAGLPVFGSFVYLSDPAIIEIIAIVGFDFVIIDTEHTAFDMSLVEHMVRGADAAGITPLVRVSDNDEKLILRALETGAQGIVIPFVSTAAEAKRAFEATRYPPEGTRGMCTATRAAQYGAVRSDYKKHEAECNREILVVGLIEDMNGVKNVGSILDAGVDVAFVGKGDLSVGLGVSNDYEHPLVISATEEVLKTAEQKGKWSGIVSHEFGDARRWLDNGCKFICYHADVHVVMAAYRTAIENLRSWTPLPTNEPLIAGKKH